MDEDHKTWQTSLRLLKLVGLYSEVKTKKTVLFATVYTIVLGYIIIMSVIQFKFIREVFDIIDNAEALAGFVQNWAKMVVVVYKQKQLTKMVEDTNRFWNTNVCEAKLKNKLDAFPIKVKQLQRLFLFCVMTCVIMSQLSVIFTDRMLPFGIWKANFGTLYKPTLISNCFMLSVIIFSCAGFDTLFLSIITEIVVQFRILYYCFSKLSVSHSSGASGNGYSRKIRPYIQQHTFLLEFSDSLRDFISVGMLIQYITVTPAVCTEMFALFESNSIQLRIKHTIICFSLLFQLGLYCFTAHWVSSEASTIADAVYNSDWYSRRNPAVLSSAVLLIQKSQRRVFFTAGGLIEMNIGTVLLVVRASYSACTVMQALKNKH